MIFQSILRFLRSVGNQNIQGEEADEQQNTHKKKAKRKQKQPKQSGNSFSVFF